MLSRNKYTILMFGITFVALISWAEIWIIYMDIGDAMIHHNTHQELGTTFVDPKSYLRASFWEQNTTKEVKVKDTQSKWYLLEDNACLFKDWLLSAMSKQETLNSDIFKNVNLYEVNQSLKLIPNRDSCLYILNPKEKEERLQWRIEIETPNEGEHLKILSLIIAIIGIGIISLICYLLIIYPYE